MPKTFAEIKKESTYPIDFEKGIKNLQITREYTIPVLTAIEKLIQPSSPKYAKTSELEMIGQVSQKYMPYFVSGSYYETLQATANVCLAVARWERDAQMEALERVVTPMKSWLQEDFPRLMKDIKKCYALKEKMDRSMACAEARRTPERVAKAEDAKQKHKQFFDRVYNEYAYEKKAKEEFETAFTKCKTEIEAGLSALKDVKSDVKTPLDSRKVENQEAKDENAPEAEEDKKKEESDKK